MYTHIYIRTFYLSKKGEILLKKRGMTKENVLANPFEK